MNQLMKTFRLDVDDAIVKVKQVSNNVWRWSFRSTSGVGNPTWGSSELSERKAKAEALRYYRSETVMPGAPKKRARWIKA